MLKGLSKKWKLFLRKMDVKKDYRWKFDSDGFPCYNSCFPIVTIRFGIINHFQNENIRWEIGIYSEKTGTESFYGEFENISHKELIKEFLTEFPIPEDFLEFVHSKKRKMRIIKGETNEK